MSDSIVVFMQHPPGFNYGKVPAYLGRSRISQTRKGAAISRSALRSRWMLKKQA